MPCERVLVSDDRLEFHLSQDMVLVLELLPEPAAPHS